MSEERIVVVGASAGGVGALMELVRGLPHDFPAPICVVLHVPPDSPSLLASILERTGVLPAKNAEQGERMHAGRIHVAVPDRHLLVSREGTLRVTRGPRENRHRPSVDPLFRSAALAYGSRTVAVILSGSLDDGTAGMIAVKQRGGICIVQDPNDALYPSMPQSALQHVDVDHCIPLARLSALLTHVVSEASATVTPAAPPNMEMETRMAELDPEALETDDRPGKPSAFSCPDCGGVLWEIDDGVYERFRCRVGHGFSPETMLNAQDELLEEALWSATKTLEESARLSRRLAAVERQRGHDWLAKRFEEKERDARERVGVIRRFLLRGDEATIPTEVPQQRRSR